VKKEYGSNAKIRFHFAPPILNLRTDSRGRPVKREFGTWMLPVLRVLARMKRLRGTAFDIFGGTAERRMERALIREFEDRVEQLLGTVDAENLADVADIVEQYMDIRGYGPVKDQAVEEVRTRVAHKISNLASRDTHAPIQARDVA
jgi:indolepyruvate ferredoxin oxidoreductase